MILFAVTAACWALLVLLGVLHVRRFLAEERAWADAEARERARREALGLEWIALGAAGDAPVRLVERDGDRVVLRDVALATHAGRTPVSLRAGAPVVAPERFLDATLSPLDAVYVLVRWPSRPEGYRDGAGPIVLEPDPERGYVLSYSRPGADDLQPRGVAPYLPFFAIAAACVALAWVPGLRWIVAALSVTWVLGEVVVLARWRALGALTAGALALSSEAYAEVIRARAERRREREAELEAGL